MKFLRKGEDDMMIFNWQYVRPAGLDPSSFVEASAFWAVPIATRIVGNLPMAAVIAGVNMAAERGGPTARNRAYGLRLDRSQRSQAIGMRSEYISQF